MEVVYVALGTNQGDLDANIAEAVALLKEIPDTVIEAQSSYKNYAPEDASLGQPDYRNGVLRIRTDLGPLDLLHKLQVIERRMGRASKGDGSSRPIDLDILSYGREVIIQGKTLTVPHPRLTNRLFVVEPLAELAPDWKHPRTGKTASELLQELKTAQGASNADLDSSPAQSLEAASVLTPASIRESSSLESLAQPSDESSQSSSSASSGA